MSRDRSSIGLMKQAATCRHVSLSRCHGDDAMETVKRTNEIDRIVQRPSVAGEQDWSRRARVSGPNDILSIGVLA